jgi:hypothetical protein
MSLLFEYRSQGKYVLRRLEMEHVWRIRKMTRYAGSHLKMIDHKFKDGGLRSNDYFVRFPLLRAVRDDEENFPEMKALRKSVSSVK